MEYDPRVGHMHWHFHDFATYDLLDANQQNPVRSGKEAFCLANTDAIDMLVHNAKWRLNFDDLGSVCGDVNSTFVREAMSVGYGDIFARTPLGKILGSTLMTMGPAMASKTLDAEADRRRDDVQEQTLDTLRKILAKLEAPAAVR